MNVAQAFLEALESLSGNKLRSGLTVLGIVIGVAAVIAMLAVGNGAQASITGSISGIGTNLLFVFRGDQNNNVRNPKPLPLAMRMHCRINLPRRISPRLRRPCRAMRQFPLPGNRVRHSCWASLPNISRCAISTLAEGDLITEEHMLGRASVVILGSQVAEDLFGHADGVTGETIRIEGQPFRVIGVLESKGGGAFGSEDNQVLIPFTTAQARLIRRAASDRVDIIFVQAASGEVVAKATDEIAQILRTRHRTPVGADDFTVFSQQDLLTTFQSITGILTIFLGGIAGISLLVGGIGIMNIMLVSVTERTREIGLRKALGARKRDILIQFLTESSLLSLIGGVIGIMLGWLISFAVGQIAAASGTDFTPIVGVDAIALATIFSAHRWTLLWDLSGQPRRESGTGGSLAI